MTHRRSLFSRHLRLPVIAFVTALVARGSGLSGCKTDPALQGTGAAAPTAVAAHRSAHPERDTLVLFDDTGPFAWLGELYGAGVAALVSHFGGWSASPISRYRGGDLLSYRAAVYVGSTFDQPVPEVFLDDVLDGARPVMWIDDNIWQLSARAHQRGRGLGFEPATFDTGRVTVVRYKGVDLARSASNQAGVMTYANVDSASSSVVAWAAREDGTTLPWALRAGHLLYVGENPLSYIGPDDRYLAFCDLLFELLAPTAGERHRALVRIEDVHPRSSPAALRALADTFASEGVPFSIAVIPVFRDPRPQGPGPATVRLRDAPDVVAALRYMLERGGTLVLHGLTHQYRDVGNPYDGVTGQDYEFFRAHVAGDGRVALDGPVPEDSARWALARVDEALRAFDEADLPRPAIFEYPHYAGSADDSYAIATRFDTVYQRETYFGGILGANPPDPARSLNLFFPFVVVDPYRWRVLPENLGNYAPPDSRSPRLPEDILESANRSRVVRDGIASFFFHPTFDPSILRQIVEGLKARQFVFVSATALRRERLGD
jgi:uncharacterized protein YdaL